MEREKMRSEGESELIELMYMVETDAGMIVPVNIGEQTEESLQGRRRVALVGTSFFSKGFYTTVLIFSRISSRIR